MIEKNMWWRRSYTDAADFVTPPIDLRLFNQATIWVDCTAFTGTSWTIVIEEVMTNPDKEPDITKVKTLHVNKIIEGAAFSNIVGVSVQALNIEKFGYYIRLTFTEDSVTASTIVVTIEAKG